MKKPIDYTFYLYKIAYYAVKFKYIHTAFNCTYYFACNNINSEVKQFIGTMV